MREHLEQVRDQMKGLPEGERLLFEASNPAIRDLDEEADIPHELDYLLVAFFEMSRKRGSNGFGPSPITYTEIESWTRLRKFPLTAWEVDVVTKLDDVFLGDAAKRLKSKSKTKSK